MDFFCLGTTSHQSHHCFHLNLLPHHCHLSFVDRRFPIRAVLCAAEGCASTKSCFHLRFWKWHRSGGRISSPSKAQAVFGTNGLFLYGLLGTSEKNPKCRFCHGYSTYPPPPRNKGLIQPYLWGVRLGGAGGPAMILYFPILLPCNCHPNLLLFRITFLRPSSDMAHHHVPSTSLTLSLTYLHPLLSHLCSQATVCPQPLGLP